LGIDFSLDLNCITDINFTKKIKEVKVILKSWQHRKLTLLGKITVIKTLALLKLIHLLTSLPNLPQTKINIEDLSFSNPPDIYHRLKYFALSYLTSRFI
jgi:hypothetical protein